MAIPAESVGKPVAVTLKQVEKWPPGHNWTWEVSKVIRSTEESCKLRKAEEFRNRGASLLGRGKHPSDDDGESKHNRGLIKVFRVLQLLAADGMMVDGIAATIMGKPTLIIPRN